MTRYSSTMTEALQEVREGFSSKQIKMAIGIASDKRYAGGNMTGAVNAIEKIKRGLSDHPQVAAVLKRQNEDIEEEIEEEIEIDEKKKVTKTFGVEFQIDAPDEKPITTGKEPHVKVINKLVKKYKLRDYHADDLSKFNVKDDVGGKDVQRFFKDLSKAGYDVIRKKITDNYTSTEFDFSEEIEIDELKMDDPKLNKIFDKLKKGQTIKLKTSSTINQGKDFVEYIVKSKNTVNKGRVEKVTLVTKGNEKAVKKFLYKRDGKVTFAIGDMGASIDDIKEGTWALPDSPKAKAELKKLMSKPIKLGKEGDDATDLMYSLIGDDELLDDLYVAGKKNPNGDARPVIKKAMKRLGIKEEVELDEGVPYKFAAVDKKGLVIGFSSDERDAKDMARRNKGRVVTLTKPLPDNKKSDQMINRPLPDKMDKFPTNTSATQGKRMGEEDEKKPDMRPDSAKEVEMGREDKKKTRIAQLQLQIAKAQETINKLNAQEKPNG